MNELLNAITSARQAEKEAKALFDAQKRLQWQTHPARIAVAEAVQDALGAGVRKNRINEALGTTNFTTFQSYLDILDGPVEETETNHEPVTNESSVEVVEVDEHTRVVKLNNFRIKKQRYTGEATFKLFGSDWINQTETPLGVAVEDALFFGQEDEETELKEAFNNVS